METKLQSGPGVAVKEMPSTEKSTQLWLGFMPVLASKERLMLSDDKQWDPELVR